MAAMLDFYFATALLMAPLLVCVGVGLYWGKKDYPFAGPFVTVLVTSVTTPALVFYTLSTTELDNRVLTELVGGTLLALLICALLCAAALRLFKLQVRQLLQTACMPNAGNLGLPLSQLAFGDVGLSAAVVFFAVASFVQHTVGVRLLSSASASSGWKTPVLLAAVAAVGLRVLGVPVPSWLLESASMLGSITVPLMLLSLGHALALIPSDGLRTGAVLAALRLPLGLLSGYGAALALGLSDELAGVLTLQMAMPCAVVSYMYARRYTDMGDVSAGAVLVSTAVFLVLAPLILGWLRAV